MIKLAVGAAKLQQAIVESSPPICGERHKCRLKHLKLMKKKKNMMIERFQSHVNYKVVDGGDVAVYL